MRQLATWKAASFAAFAGMKITIWKKLAQNLLLPL